MRHPEIDAPVTVKDSTRSTQDDARAGLLSGAPHGAVYTAERQIEGRGRRGRRWLTTPGGLLFSIVARTVSAPAGETGRLTIATVVGVARAVQTCTGASVSIKWPNDLMFDQAKAGGVLVETYGDSAVVGVGLNAYRGAGVAAGQATAAVAAYATRAFERDNLLATCVVRILDCLAADGPAWDEIHAEWVRRSMIVGRQVKVTGAACALGLVEGFDRDGALRLRDAAGRLQRIGSGDVSLRLPADDPPRRP